MTSEALIILMIVVPLAALLVVAWGVRGPSLFTIRMWRARARIDKFSWACIGHNPTRWGLGLLCRWVGGPSIFRSLSNIIADTRRNKNGTWTWWVQGYRYAIMGIEPSNEWAMQTATDTAIADAEGEEAK